MEGKAYYQFLLERYAAGTATPAETADLFHELSRQEDDQDWQELVEAITLKEEKDPAYDAGRWEPVLQNILKKSVPVRRLWPRIAAAAVLVIVAATWLWTNRSTPVDTSIEIVTTQDVLPPAGTKATITLADGTTVYLDSAGSGTLALQNNIQVIKTTDGKIQYQDTAANGVSSLPSDVLHLTYNTLTNPRGSKVIDITLSDGTHVWLNAGSSLKYPVAFVGKERKVEITGEAYFEVAHNASKPFKVALPGEVGEVEVLGTHFNINAYDDEDALKVTLLEGSVKLSASSTQKIRSSAILKPGEQGQLQTTNYKLQTIHVEDIDAVMAWKNGRFEFGGNDLSSLMRQLSRWYDVEIVYEGVRPEANFRGSISRQESITGVLKMLELTKAVKFRVEGKKVFVSK